MPAVPSSPATDWARFTPGLMDGVTRMQAHFTQHAFERHSHPTFSVGVTFAGVQTFHCRGTRHASVQGNVILLNPDEPHDGQRGSDDGFSYAIVYIEPQALDRQLALDGQAARRRHFKRTVVEDAAVGARVASALAAMGQAGESMRAEERLTQLLQDLLLRHGDAPDTRSSPADPGAARMARVRDLIESHHAEDLTVERLAEQVGLSRAHLTRAFTAACGMPPHLYLNHVRLQRAQALLRAGHTLADTAAATGFADQSHLSKRFKGSVGLSPAAWLRQVQPG